MFSCLSLNQLEPEAIKKEGRIKKAPPRQSLAGEMPNSLKQGRAVAHIRAKELHLQGQPKQQVGVELSEAIILLPSTSTAQPSPDIP